MTLPSPSRLLPQGEAHRIQLSLGPIHYEVQGEGKPVVFVHGALTDGSLWDETARELARDHQVFLPTWPLGSHIEPMKENVELSPRSVAALVAEFIEHLGLEDVTLVGNDSGGAISQLTVVHHPANISRIVLTNCDAFEVFPPKAFEYFTALPKVPGLLTVLSKEMHAFPPIARMPTAFGQLTVGRLASPTLRRWFRPTAKSKAIRRDMAKLLRSVDKQDTIDAGARLGEFDGDALLVWGTQDRHFTLDLAKRLQRAFRNARLVEVPSATTFLSLDEPQLLAREIRAFTIGAKAEPARPNLELASA